MPLSNATVREHADALNILFNAQQAAVIMALVNAAADEAGAGLQDQIDALDARVDVLEAAP